MFQCGCRWLGFNERGCVSERERGCGLISRVQGAGCRVWIYPARKLRHDSTLRYAPAREQPQPSVPATGQKRAVKSPLLPGRGHTGSAAARHVETEVSHCQAQGNSRHRLEGVEGSLGSDLGLGEVQRRRYIWPGARTLSWAIDPLDRPGMQRWPQPENRLRPPEATRRHSRNIVNDVPAGAPLMTRVLHVLMAFFGHLVEG